MSGSARGEAVAFNEAIEDCDYYFQPSRKTGGALLQYLPAQAVRDWIVRLRQDGSISERRLVVLNGRQNAVDRALVGLRAIERSANALGGYRVAVFFTGAYTEGWYSVELAARLFSRSTGIPVEFESSGDLADPGMRLLGAARIWIGLSLEDDLLPQLALAIQMGAFPITSALGAAADLLANGATGFLVHPEDPEVVEEAIRRALSDDALVDAAERENARLIAEPSSAVSREDCLAFYRQIIDGPTTPPSP
jgi:glycosyltransferase involved in cell wall biosynthesis